MSSDPPQPIEPPSLDSENSIVDDVYTECGEHNERLLKLFYSVLIEDYGFDPTFIVESVRSGNMDDFREGVTLGIELSMMMEHV